MLRSITFWLHILFIAGCAGTALELVFTEHYESFWQWVPLAILCMGLITGALALYRSESAINRLHGGVGLIMMISGLVGIYFHVRGNSEFVLESRPGMTGFELIWEVLSGAFPVLAPTAMIYLGALALITAVVNEQTSSTKT